MDMASSKAVAFWRHFSLTLGFERTYFLLFGARTRSSPEAIVLFCFLFYMVPAVLISLEDLPMIHTGKKKSWCQP